jgi:thiol-disulfide isomerase/thioredoxin
MMKRCFLAAALLLTTAIGALAQQEDADAKYATDLLKPGTEAPEFVVDLSKPKRNIPLSSFRGRYVVLDFWASWCPDCRKDIAAMKQLRDKYAPRGVQFIGISFDTDRDAWLKCIRQNEMRWLQYSELKKWKKETKIDRDYHVNWIPTMYLVAPDGKIDLGTVMIEKLAARLAEVADTLPLADVAERPQYAGGTEALMSFLSQNLRYPEAARKLGAEGRVVMSFVVEKDGSISSITAPDCTITGYDHAKFDKLTLSEQQELKRQCLLQMAREGARVVKAMPKWKPGTQKGEPVRAQYRLPLTFRMQ